MTTPARSVRQIPPLSQPSYQRLRPANNLQVAYKHFQRVLAQWPKDRLRPESQLQDVLTKRIDKQFAEQKAGSTAGVLSEEAELKQVNAMYSLLEDRYKTKVRFLRMLSEKTFKH